MGRGAAWLTRWLWGAVFALVVTSLAVLAAPPVFSGTPPAPVRVTAASAKPASVKIVSGQPTPTTPSVLPVTVQPVGRTVGQPVGNATGDDLKTMLAQAQELLDAGSALESSEAYQRIYRLATREADRAFALVRLADIQALYFDARRQAIALYARAIKDHPRSPYLENAFFNGGMLLAEEGRHAEAAAAFRGYRGAFGRGARREAARDMELRMRELAAARDGGAPSASPGGAVRDKASRLPGAKSGASGGREPDIRVSLGRKGVMSLALGAAAEVRVPSGKRRRLLPGVYRLDVAGGQVRIKGFRVGKDAAIHAPGGFVLGGKRYEGGLRLLVEKGQLLAVLALPLERYVAGVVPMEMPVTFEPSALQAQAVAARTYAANAAASRSGKPYDLTDGEASQVFGGARAGNALTRHAAASTAGQMLVFGGSPIAAFFHSHSGGMLEDDAAIWNADKPYYAVREDAVSNRARDMAWEYRVSRQELARVLRAKGYTLRRVDGARPLARSRSGRVTMVRLATDLGALDVEGDSLRLMLDGHKVRSTLFTLGREGDEFVFRGRGFGHGVGMSQWGAQGMALAGSNYRAILAYYYPGVTLARRY